MTENTPIASAIQQESAAVIAELENTLQLAEQYVELETLESEVLLSHIGAIDEDLQAVLQQMQDDPTICGTAKNMKRAARRVKRDIERLIPKTEKEEEEHDLHKYPPMKNLASDIKNEATKTSMKLPPCQLPVFAGDAAEFSVFYDTFQATVVNNITIPHMAKWLYLKSSLTGKALEMVKGLPQSADMFEVALEILQDAYGDKERTIVEHYQKIQDLPGAENTEDSLRSTYSQLEGMIRGLERMGHDVQNNEYIRAVYIGKFPKKVNFQTVKRGMPLQQIRKNVNDYIMSCECIAGQRVEPKKQSSMSSLTKKNVTQRSPTKQLEKQPPKCLFCSELHWSDECHKIVTAAQRKQAIPDRCPKCVRLSHPGTECSRRRRCIYCDSLDHNRALCPKQFPEQSKTLLMTQRTQHWTSLAGKFWTLMVKVSTDSSPKTVQARALLDPGSARSFITRIVAQELSIETSKKHLTHITSACSTEIGTVAAAESKITISTKYGACGLNVFVMDEIVDDVPASDVERFKQECPQYRNLFLPPTGEGRQVNILIGNDNIVNLLELQKCVRIDTHKQLLATKLGWLLITSNDETAEQVTPILTITTDEQIKRMWDLEILGLKYIEHPEADEESKAISVFYNNIRHINGRYEVTWPWRQFPPQMNENYGLALGRLNSLWKQLRGKPEILKEYDDIINNQLQAGIIEHTHKSTGSLVVRYIPHHPVICPHKNTKIRPVYDASAKSGKADRSLNECLLKGKKWLEDMPALLFRLRIGETAVVADIAKAYHQIGIKETDRDVLRFLWLKNLHRPPVADNIQIFRFCRMAFGVVSSPFLLYATITHHLRSKISPITEILTQHMYADNLVATIPQHIDPTRFYDETKERFNAMSMNLTKWATNNEKLKEHIPATDRDCESEQMVLGMIWQTKEDRLQLKRPRAANTLRFTKRVVLSYLAAAFDPLGWAVPITLKAKIFIRKLWKISAKWDEQLSIELQDEWQEIRENLDKIESIVLPRQMFSKQTDMGIISMHVFVDASKEATASVIYAQRKLGSKVEIAFVASKSKLTPKTQLSIPRLELLAVLLATRYVKYIKTAMKLPVETEIRLWSDSKCVLTWILTHKIKPTIIEKQIDEIRIAKITKFMYVPSEANPADIASRGSNLITLQKMKWWTPPDWLYDEQTWPKQTTIIDELVADQEITLLTIESPPITKNKATKYTIGLMGMQINKYSSLIKLLQVTATCIKAINKFLKREVIEITDNEVRTAKKLWIRWEQKMCYTEYEQLKKNVPRMIRNTRVFLDDERIIRCQSRLQNTRLDRNAVTPILLMNGTYLTKLIILNLHNENKHVSAAHVLMLLRQNYHLPKARREISATISKNCYIYRKYTAQPYSNPPPAPLPEFRVTKGTRPFAATGMDVFGPYQVRTANLKNTNTLKEKRWVMIFTCATIRAVHLEIIQDMTTGEMLDAIRRFAARRGTPELIICDNAPQFHVIEGRFLNLWRTLKNDNAVTNYFAKKEIQFKFIPQNSPWMGGFYERVIKDIKHALERTYGCLVLHARQFTTSICEIEAVINSRPLSYVDRDPDSMMITPSDFLAAKYPAIDLDQQRQQDEDTISKLWYASQKNLDAFWEIWSQTYLMTLRERDDQLKNRRNNKAYPPKIGELVLITEPEKRRSSWQMARVIRLITSADGAVRSLLLQLPKGDKVIRPVIKTAPLKISTALTDEVQVELSNDRQNVILPVSEGAPDEEQMEEIITVYPNDEICN